jgi:hypothetical protein
MSGGEVDDAKSSHSQAHLAIDKESFVVRTPMKQGAVHGSQPIPVDHAQGIKMQDSGDSAHFSQPGNLVKDKVRIVSYHHLVTISVERGEASCTGLARII